MSRQRVEPGPGQESAWGYPRPRGAEGRGGRRGRGRRRRARGGGVEEKVRVVFGGVTIAYTTRAKRVLETSHPPVYYVPPEDIRMEYLRPSAGTSYRSAERRGGNAGSA